MQAMSTPSRTFAFLVFSIGRLGAPLFLLISGYLLLDRTYDDNACKKFWKTKCVWLFFVIEIWNIIYYSFNWIFYRNEVITNKIIRQLFFLDGFSMNHMWYMEMILGMYFTLPIAANALKAIQARTIWIPYGIFVLFAFGIPTLNVFFKVLFKEDLGQIFISMGFSGGEYGLYLITGYLLKKGLLKKISTKCLSFVASINFFVIVFMQLYVYNKGMTYNVYYDNFFLFSCGVCLFEQLSRIKKIPFQKAFQIIAEYSFAIYLVHNPVNKRLKTYLIDVGNKPMRVLIVWITTMLVSLFLSYLISKIPKIGKKILYMK